MTLEVRSILKESWLTLFKNKKTGIFNSKPAVSYANTLVLYITRVHCRCARNTLLHCACIL